MQTTVIDRQYWNIVKGIGIILVVLGHINTPATNYIYLFHMPLFFFVSGYLYNEDKYGDNPYLNIAAKLKSSWIKYVGVYLVFIMLHNLFYENGILEPDAKVYTVKLFFVVLSQVIVGAGSEFLAGPLWFVPVSIISSCILGFIITYSRRIERQYNKTKYFIQFVFILICTLLGYYLMKKHCDLHAHMQISLVVMPCLWGGYLLRNSKVDFNKYLNPIVAIVCAILVFIASLYFELELVLFMKVYPYMHLVAFLGIYMCLYLAKLFAGIPHIKNMLDWSGQASFFIMATHYAIFRLFDWGMTQIFCPEDPRTKYLELPNSFPELGPVYFLIGYIVPLLIFVGWKKVRKEDE